MKIIVFGGDGFCGWPTALHLANSGHIVHIVDNLSRRQIDIDYSLNSLSEISDLPTRVEVANNIVGEISYSIFDVSENFDHFVELMLRFEPDAVIHFAEQRSAPYSMLGHKERHYTVVNNISSTHMICSAIIETNPNIHFLHLGTMGVYGYNDDLGMIPDGYLDVTVDSTGKKTKIIFPGNPGSIYHTTKVLDHSILQFYSKNWNLRVTDLHQGIVWGFETDLTKKDPRLTNRFDYDGIYGTVLNRFIVQSVMGHPLSVYGTGGQTRAFINISDTAKCLELALNNMSGFEDGKVRVFNQIAETKSVIELAKLCAAKFNVEIEYLQNPRNELSENKLRVTNEGFKSIGFDPILLNDQLISDVAALRTNFSNDFIAKNVNNSPKWN